MEVVWRAFRNPALDRLVCGLPLRSRLAPLEIVQIEGRRLAFRIVQDRVPREKASGGILQLLQPLAVSGKEKDSVTIQSGTVASTLEDFLGLHQS